MVGGLWISNKQPLNLSDLRQQWISVSRLVCLPMVRGRLPFTRSFRNQTDRADSFSNAVKSPEGFQTVTSMLQPGGKCVPSTHNLLAITDHMAPSNHPGDRRDTLLLEIPSFGPNDHPSGGLWVCPACALPASEFHPPPDDP